MKLKIITAIAVSLFLTISTFAWETDTEMKIENFPLYDPPDSLSIVWHDYLEKTDSGYIPSKGNKPTEYPTPNNDFPYRAVFYGGFADHTASPQGYYTEMYTVYSKVPVSDLFEFRYLPSRGSYGHIQAKAVDRTEIDWTKDCVVLRYGWSGISGVGATVVYQRTFSMHIVPANWDYTFTFDFYYQCCGDLEIKGLRNITDVPYNYILTCKEADGTGGGSEPGKKPDDGSSGGGGESSGSSGGGGESSGSSGGGDESSGSSGGGETSGGSSSSGKDRKPPGGKWEDSENGKGNNPNKYPFEKDDGPNLDWGFTIPEHERGIERDTGEQGDTWELPTYEVQDPPFTDKDLNIPKMPNIKVPPTPVLPTPNAPILDYKPDIAGKWPPAFPGVGSSSPDYPYPWKDSVGIDFPDILLPGGGFDFPNILG